MNGEDRTLLRIALERCYGKDAAPYLLATLDEAAVEQGKAEAVDPFDDGDEPMAEYYEWMDYDPDC